MTCPTTATDTLCPIVISLNKEKQNINPQIKSVDNRGTYSADTGNIYYQGKKANGFYDPELGVIVLGRNMNEMTLPHEMQHYWLDKIFSIYKRAKSGELQVRDKWMTETKALFDMLGIDENQTQLTQGQQEKFACNIQGGPGNRNYKKS